MTQRTSLSVYENGQEISSEEERSDSLEQLRTVALAQHDGKGDGIARLIFGSDITPNVLTKALLIEGDVGSGELARLTMSKLSKLIDGHCGALEVQATRFPLDMNRRRDSAITPDVEDDIKEILLEAYDETRTEILRTLGRLGPGGVVFDVHSMWPMDLARSISPKSASALLDSTASHVLPSNWGRPRQTLVCKGDLSKFPHLADPELFDAVAREFGAIGLDFTMDRPFGPEYLNITFTGELYARKKIRSLIVDVPKHELHEGTREEYATAPWDVKLSQEKIGRIGGALARAASSVLLSNRK